MALTAQQLEERRGGIGGSDVRDLLSLAPFGCSRKLWYDKRGVREDFPWRGNAHARRGDVLEDIAVEEYFSRTARRSWKTPRKVDPEVPYFAANADALQEIQEGGPPSALEIKCPSVRWYYSARNRPDPPLDAMAQLQWVAMVHRLDMGTVLLFCADQWSLRFWDVPADPAMQENLRTLGHRFWKTLQKEENPHPKLDPRDSRCSQCPWRKTCQRLGAEAALGEPIEFASADVEPVQANCTTREANEAMMAFVATRQALRQAETEHELSKARLLSIFPSEGKIETDLGSAKLKTVYRGEYTAVVKATTYPLLTVKPKVEEHPDEFGDFVTF